MERPKASISHQMIGKTDYEKELEKYIDYLESKAKDSGVIHDVSGSLSIADARELAKNTYARITSYANYQQMNGIESHWIIECIAKDLVRANENYG